jgi:hypothetical protein
MLSERVTISKMNSDYLDFLTRDWQPMNGSSMEDVELEAKFEHI